MVLLWNVIKTKDTELIEAFGLRIRMLRKERSLSMEKLAELSGIDYRQFSYVELGEQIPPYHSLSYLPFPNPAYLRQWESCNF